jgi:hypothetical protein
MPDSCNGAVVAPPELPGSGRVRDIHVRGSDTMMRKFAIASLLTAGVILSGSALAQTDPTPATQAMPASTPAPAAAPAAASTAAPAASTTTKHHKKHHKAKTTAAPASASTAG